MVEKVEIVFENSGNYISHLEERGRENMSTDKATL